MARTTKKTTIRPAKKRKNPNFRRRRRSDSLRELGSTVIGARTGTGALYGTSAATGSTSALIGAAARTGSGGTAGGAGRGSSSADVVWLGNGWTGALAG